MRSREMAASPLQDEVKKRNPFDAPEQEVALNLVKTTEFIQAGFARLFKQHQISGAQYNVLRILRGADAALPCLEVAGRMISHLPDITRLVDRLEAAGLVARCRTSEDRRVVLVEITKAGRQLLADLDAPVLELHRQEFAFDDQDPAKGLFSFQVKAASIDTGNAKRDQHLKGPDFFNVVQFPTIAFKSRAVARSGADAYEVTGDLTLHGVTRPVSLKVT